MGALLYYLESELNWRERTAEPPVPRPCTQEELARLKECGIYREDDVSIQVDIRWDSSIDLWVATCPTDTAYILQDRSYDNIVSLILAEIPALQEKHHLKACGSLVISTEDRTIAIK